MAQKFYLEYQNEGFYKILAVHTGKCLTAKGNSIKEGVDIVQYDYQGLDSQKWILRDTYINGWVISPLSNPLLSISVYGKIQNGAKLILSETQDNDNQMLYMYKIRNVVNIDTDKYPGFYEKIDRLLVDHPNWEFEFLYTNLDFKTAVQGEYEFANKRGNLVYTPLYKGDWIAPNPFVSGVWSSASYKGIAYFMDTRNFLNDIDVFQFVDLSNYSSSGATLEAIQGQVYNTFLQDYARDLQRICQNVNINPYFAIARLFQEQGKDGSGTINMDGGDGKQYFNPFNINAQVGNDIPTALAKAKEKGWDTMAKGLEGGMRIMKAEYIDRKQHTLYLNKFDVNPASGGGFYNHQYMQNLSAAYSEAQTLRGAYKDTGAIDNKIRFVIPVYENMPYNPSERPTGQNVNIDSSNSNCNERVMVNSSNGVNVRSGPGTNYGVVTSIPNGYRGTRIKTGDYNQNDNLWWDKVVFDDGSVGYVASKYLTKI